MFSWEDAESLLWVVCVSVCVRVCEGGVGGCYLVTKSCWALLWPPRTAACQAPLPVRFPRREYLWENRLPLPSPGYLPEPGVEPGSSVSAYVFCSGCMIPLLD